ncbi:LCP family protein [Streptomyces sp. NBC_01431]|uniref:LCP family protein n=1 Tax=Streptomyces sp. NBC_01431 TaxID=2903863 RepID=UPI002E3315DA|nr:LCP family protein [Streptomyces sp. NBC_01431]
MTGGQKGSDRRGGGSPAVRGRRLRRRGVRLGMGIAVALLVLVAAGVGWAYLRLDGNIATFNADGVSGDRPPVSTKGSNVLVIGTDARIDGNSELGGGDKDDIGRSDTAFLMHVYADHKHAVAVSIPRDTLVDIPSCKLPDGSWTKPQSNTMFNAAYSVGESAKGNPACTQNTVEKLTGLRVDHTVVVDFKGFAKMTEAVGGVAVCVPQDVYQNNLNPNRATRGERIFVKGPQTVSGQQALDYVRIRHGIGDGSDIGRIKRQQAFVASLIKKVKSGGLTPTKLFPLADAATQSLTVDPGLGSADKLISFAMSLRDIDLHNTKFVTLPWRYQGARVAIVHPDAEALWDALKSDRTLDGQDASGHHDERAGGASPAPSGATVNGAGISVAVYNGTTLADLTARAADALKQHGFTVTSTATALVRTQAGTVIEYGPGQQDQAQKAAELFPGAEVTPAAAAGVNIILGRTYENAPQAGAPTGPAVPTASAAPSALPTGVAGDSRSADDDPCSNLSYG